MRKLQTRGEFYPELSGFTLSFYKPYLITVVIKGPETRRSADIAIYEKLNEALDDEYAKTPPKIVIEIDVKVQGDQAAQLDEKTKELLEFGVEKVVWVHSQAVVLISSLTFL